MVAVPLKTDLFKSKVETTTMNPLVSAEFEHNKNAVDQDVKDESAKSMKKILLRQLKRQLYLKKLAPVATESNSYFVITGSFKSEENAISQVNMLKAEGFTPEIVAAPNGFYRVCAMACSDLNTAISKKRQYCQKVPGILGFQKKIDH